MCLANSSAMTMRLQLMIGLWLQSPILRPRGLAAATFIQISNVMRTRSPRIAEAWLGQGNVFFELNKHSDALTAYDEALNLKSDLAEAWLGRGNVLTEVKQHDAALSAYDRALAVGPELAEPWLGQGIVLAGLKRYADAFAAYDRAVALNPRLA